ncbi:MAG: hypothetical protein COS72_00575, partial [Candidatus Moranbacteria bacterium CG06_land_8_20_14_3_00_43_56]
GLLAREYIESTYYQNDIDQLITIGTPHLGAPKDYMTWEGGEFMGFESVALKYFFNQEAKENGYDSIFHYIRGRPMSSVQELLPVYDYLYDDNGSDYDLRTGYPANYPRNEFLENLNKREKTAELADTTELSNIVGKQDRQTTTISGYNVVNADMGELWEYGYPHGFEVPWVGDQGLRKSDGDGTVPLYSAEAEQIPFDKTIYFQSRHNGLPTDTQKDILEILIGIRPENEVREWKIDDILISLVFSPVDFQIISPSGERLGKDFKTGEELNEIEGAYYSGFDTDTEFITIPNPEDGEYKILAEGTGEGKYKIEMTKITEDENDPEKTKVSTATIEGMTESGQVQEAEIEITEEEVIYNPDTTPPTIIISSPEEKIYFNDQYDLPVEYSITDDVSASEDITKTIEYDNQPFAEIRLDLSLEFLGEHSFKIAATDEAGNTGEKTTTFQITTNLDAIQDNINHYWDLKLIKKKIAKRYLTIKLGHIEKLFDLLEKIENSKLKPKPKQAVIDALKEVINADINRLIKQINRRIPRWFDQNIADLLTESLGCLKIN